MQIEKEPVAETLYLLQALKRNKFAIRVESLCCTGSVEIGQERKTHQHLWTGSYGRAVFLE